MKYDVESLITDIVEFSRANLNAKLAEIDAEKADGITLDPIDPNAYVIQTLTREDVAYDPFLLCGIDKTNTQSSGPYSVKSYTISVIIGKSDPGQDPNITNRMFRYSRALSELFEDNWGQITTIASKLNIESLEPIAFKLMDNPNENYRAVGVSIQAAIA